MFRKAKDMDDLNRMKQAKESKIVRNKKRLSSRDIGKQRTKLNNDFSIRAQEIITATINLPR